MALYSELSATNPAWKKIYEDYSNFRRDANLWFRFTEAGFDDFMQSAKALMQRRASARCKKTPPRRGFSLAAAAGPPLRASSSCSRFIDSSALHRVSSASSTRVPARRAPPAPEARRRRRRPRRRRVARRPRLRLHLLEALSTSTVGSLLEAARHQPREGDDQADHDDLDDHERHRAPVDLPGGDAWRSRLPVTRSL